jgi:Arc/MetJ-type ribon-helix-helix transcriptional regulator
LSSGHIIPITRPVAVIEMATFLPDIEAYVQQKLATGQFRSREELAAEAIRLYRDLEVTHAQLKSDVQAAIDEAEQGLTEPLDIDDIKAEIMSELDAESRKS